MKQTFPFNFNDALLNTGGSIHLEKVNQNCSPNYQYFKIKFIEGYLHIKNKSGDILEKYDLKDLISLIALKKDYLKLSSPNNKKTKGFTNIKNKHLENRFNLYIINEDINKKITKNGFLEEIILNRLLLSILLGNEENLLQIA
ncbi:toxin [Clostridium botulinum]|uniref:toxin n=1 Tax=Clostridium botulinum TaxID=1491 RepID=UPI00099CC540|nr:toxin [Clostridium botulinum]OPD18568.1 toxin [Clostridium botulinum]